MKENQTPWNSWSLANNREC